MLQTILKIIFSSLFLIFVNGIDGYAAPSTAQATLSVRDIYHYGKEENSHDLKLMHPGSLRCRIPQPQKTFSPKDFSKTDYTGQKAIPALVLASTRTSNNADSAYIFGIIYPFHFFY